MAKKGKAKMGKAKAAAQKRMQPEVVGASAADSKVLEDLAGASAIGGMWKGRVPGDTIIGEVLVMKEEKSRFKKGEKQTVITLGTGEGTVTIFCNVSLLRAVEAQKVKVGDRIGVQYKGTQSVGKGRPMNVYVCRKIAVDRKGRGK